MVERVRIVVESSTDTPNSIVKREMGKTNLGVYCRNRDCLEFISLAVSEPNPNVELEIVSNPPEAGILVECWNCKQAIRYQSHDFESVALNEHNKRRSLSN